MPKILKKADFIKSIIGQKRFNIRKIFNLSLNIIISEFFNCLN